MSMVKIVILIGYGVLIYLAVGAQGSDIASFAKWTLIALLAAHIVEVAVFFNRCKKAGGSLPLHLLNVLLFGVFHMRELKTA